MSYWPFKLNRSKSDPCHLYQFQMGKGHDGAQGGTEGCPLIKAWGFLKQVSVGQNDLSKFIPALDLDFGHTDSETSLRLPIQTNQTCNKPVLKTKLLTCYFPVEITWWEGTLWLMNFPLCHTKLLCILDYKMSLTILLN